MLEVVGLAGMQKRLPRQLSGGQQQRVALARALAFDPELLLMDEPLGALDRELRVRMTGELRRIQRELRTTLVYVTHDRDEALTLSDRIAIMRDGRLEGSGARRRTSTVVRRRGSSRASSAGTTSSTSTSSTTQTASRRSPGTIGGRRSPSGTPVEPGSHGLVVPTRALRVPGERDRGSPVIVGEVVETLYMGDEVRTRVRLEGGDVLIAHLATGQELGPAPGDTLELAVDEARLSVVPRTHAGAG